MEKYSIQETTYLSKRNKGLFANHSCNPSAGINRELYLIAVKDIFPGEEITHDYSAWMDEDHWVMECACQSDTCRGIVKDFKYLPENIQQKYLNAGIVLPSI